MGENCSQQRQRLLRGPVVSEYPVIEFSSVLGATARLSNTARTAFRATRVTVAALLALPILMSSATLAAAEADRSLKLFFTHTGERATITFKRDGRFDPKGLAQINRFLRDWRKNEPARMDPRLLDLVWDVYDRSGATDYIHIVSAYRSPATNNMLRGRSRSTGVAKNSQHTLGKAMDFFIPGVKLATLRSLAMQAQVGGVGFYPTSGSPFVHLDVGNVRAWPRMTRMELARIFPGGKTMHLPADGRPLPGYDLAVADYKRRVGPRSIEIADTAEDDDAGPVTSSRNSLVTAMLPTPTSRVEEALELQTGKGLKLSVSKPEFVDLDLMTVPVPSMRPVMVEDQSAVETAALGPFSIFVTGSVLRPKSVPGLREPAISSGSLTMMAVEKGLKKPGTRKALVAWALSSPGAETAMTAPIFGLRILTGGGGM
ncbi:DUF882 domain-containing protein, partial [Rhizobium sp.]|uniref:DUF882 domain-containing protein n=1 Tax=Rhizobium sp. TaxID=391 RepID=UPI0039182C45